MKGSLTTPTFCERVIAAATTRPNKIAMVAPTETGTEAITFNEMLSQIRSLAYRLSLEKIEFGDRIALLGENHPHWALAYFGILFRGAIAVPLDPAATVEALTHFISDSQARLAFVSPTSFDKFRAICERLGRQIPVVALRDSSEQNGHLSFQAWSHTPVPTDFASTPPPAKAEDIAVLMYTSGTTGTPKAVPLTHGNINAESTALQEAIPLTDKEVVLSLLPMFHAYSQTVNLWLATIFGAEVYYVTELSSAAIERALQASCATALVGVPRLWYLFHKKVFDQVKQQPALSRWFFAAMIKVNGWLRDYLKINAGRLFFGRVHTAFGGRLHLAVSGGASFDPGVARDFHCLGFTILQGYGLTETAAAATATRLEDNLIGSVGKPLKDVEIKIDEPNEAGIGEVLIRGPIVMPGYYRNPEANREVFTADGWFRTGDLGHFDKNGHLFISGRSKDVIKLPSGKNVFPEDVEAHYQHSPFVSEICVLGVRDQASSFARAEKLVAVVVPDFDYLKTQHIANAREWVQWELDNLGRELPEYQRARDYIIRTEPLPRTSTRKVKRFEVKRWLESTDAMADQTRNLKRFAFTDADKAMMNSIVGKVLTAAIQQQKPETELIHPQMNLELDLGLDSLARAECAVSIEQSLGASFKPEEFATALTVGEVIALTEKKAGKVAVTMAGSGVNWHHILADVSPVFPDVQPILKHKPVTLWVAWLLLKMIYLAARVMFRLEVEGREVLTKLDPPFLICPNHQSYLDAFLVCSIYPRSLLSRTFHVGATQYFSSGLGKWLADKFNIIPVDADTNLLRAMRAGAAGIGAGHVLNLYPEGQRSLDGELAEFRKGAAILATELNVSIVPVALDGLHRVWPRGAKWLHLAKVKINFGAPLNITEEVSSVIAGDARYEAVTDLLRKRIQQMLDELRPSE